MEFEDILQLLLQDFNKAELLHPLNQIQLLHDDARQRNIAKVMLFPLPLWIYYRINTLLKSNPALKHFQKGILLNLPLVAFSSIFYLVMWWHMLPIAHNFLPVLQSPNHIETFVKSLWDEHSFRTLWAIAAHLLVSLWTLSDFKLTDTFTEQINAFQQTIAKKWEDGLVRVVVQQQLETLQLEFIKNLSTQFTTMILANGDLNPQEQQKIINTFSKILQQLPASSASRLEAPLPHNTITHAYGEDPFS